jgi:hypothetical protein
MVQRAWTRKLQLYGHHGNGSKAQIVELTGLNYASGNGVSQQWLACALDYHRHYQPGTCTVLAGCLHSDNENRLAMNGR